MTKVTGFPFQLVVYMYFYSMNNPLLRIFLIVALVLGLLMLGKFTALGDWFNLQNILSSIQEAGIWGFVIFLALFVAGSFLQIPAMIFVLVALLVYGPINGTVLGYIGVVVAMSVNYFTIRKLGSGAINQLKHNWVQRLLARLDQKPVTTVILLRLIFWAAPVLNYTLAMTAIKPRHYLLGSIIGIIIPILLFSGAVYFFEQMVFRWVT